MKKKNTLTKALLVTLSILGLVASLGRSTLYARAAENIYVYESCDPDTNPVDFTL